MMEEKTILLVEDNQDDVDLTLRALERNNIMNEVVVVRDGAEALEYFFGTEERQGCAGGKMPELVLLDLKLPKVDGLEVLKRLRADERTRLLPVVIFTSSKEERDLVEGYSLGANSYVHKPVDFTEFAESVSRLGMYWLLLNQPPPHKGD